MDKLAELNKMEVVDYSISCNEVEYVAVENNEENRQLLISLGATEEELLEMAGDTLDNDTLDIAYFAFNECDAGWWSVKEGFGYDE